MKNPWLLIGLAVTGLGLPFITWTQEPAPPAFKRAETATQAESTEPEMFDEDVNRPKLIRVQVEFVELSHEALTKLLFLSKPTRSNATDLRKQVQEMVSKDEAKLGSTLEVERLGTNSTPDFFRPVDRSHAIQISCKGTDDSDILFLSPKPLNFATACLWLRTWRVESAPQESEFGAWNDSLLHEMNEQRRTSLEIRRF